MKIIKVSLLVLAIYYLIGLLIIIPVVFAIKLPDDYRESGGYLGLLKSSVTYQQAFLWPGHVFFALFAPTYGEGNQQ